jgi:hypothetical protein
MQEESGSDRFPEGRFLGPRTVPIFFENSMGLEAYPCLPSGVDPACHGKYGYSRVARATATPNGLPSRWQKTASVSCLRTVERWTRPDRSLRNYEHSVCCSSTPTCFASCVLVCFVSCPEALGTRDLFFGSLCSRRTLRECSESTWKASLVQAVHWHAERASSRARSNARELQCLSQ